jgi:small subunit ribosomal protein S8
MIADPISDFIIRLQNAAMVGKTSVAMPNSKMKVAVANVLAREGYLADVDVPKSNMPLSTPLVVTLAYRGSSPAITGVKRISKPSRRLYAGVTDIRPVKRGHGTLLLSTPQGILTGKEAKEKKVGGELLFEIW